MGKPVFIDIFKDCSNELLLKMHQILDNIYLAHLVILFYSWIMICIGLSYVWQDSSIRANISFRFDQLCHPQWKPLL